jgi:hypothetical protein
MSVFGQIVTFTAAVDPVAPGGGVPTGTVTFGIDGTPIAPPVALDGTGEASYATGALNVVGSPHDVDATYSGDANFTTSAAVTLSYVVTQADTTTALSPDIPSG